MRSSVEAVSSSAGFDQRADRVRDHLRQCICELNLDNERELIDAGVDRPFAEQEDRQDPFDQSVTTFGFWRDSNGKLLGTLQIKESGRVYAEYDLVCNHPGKAGWFIESVNVWGDDTGLKSELQLLKLPG
tara:strand:+ start:838 stop:1227 length:390 start_codon:yes stop_codon:yes gene_type:complete